MKRKANTMKTYILRKPKPVEPQKSSCPPRPKPAAPVVAKGPILFIGLDVHNDSIAVSLAPSDSTEVRRYGIIGGEHDDVLKLAHKLQAAHPGMVLKFCYEAGPRGFALCRCLRVHGRDCILVCPSKVPRKPGERVKTDRRDADDLARLYRAGELTLQGTAAGCTFSGLTPGVNYTIAVNAVGAAGPSNWSNPASLIVN
jgi:hypothetical protein